MSFRVSSGVAENAPASFRLFPSLTDSVPVRSSVSLWPSAERAPPTALLMLVIVVEPLTTTKIVCRLNLSGSSRWRRA